MHANYITGERPCPIEPHRPAAAANSSITGGDNTDGEATMDISLLVSLPVNELIKLLINQCAAGVERGARRRGTSSALPFIVDPAEEHIFQ